MNASSSFGRLLAWGRERLKPGEAPAALEAELLLCFVTGQSRSVVLAFPERCIGAELVAAYRDAVRERACGRPLAQITGRREFYSLELEVNGDVLIPRPETELLVDLALEYLDSQPGRSLLDLGTGSGAIALAVKRARPDVEVTASDIAAGALETGRRNADRLGIELRFVRSDWLDGLAGRRFDLIVCNPPYVASADRHFEGALKYEPRLALDGGADGLDAYRAILGGAGRHLARRGLLLLEHGWDQREAIMDLAARSEFRVVAVRRDLGDRPRVLVLGGD